MASTQSSKFLTAKGSNMEFRFLGNSGLLVSALSFGAWLTFQGADEKTIEKNTYEMIKTAIQCGCNFFDNAEVYGNGQAETMMGKAIRRLISENVIKRRDVVITTKIYWGDASTPNAHGLSRKHIMEAMDDCLERLGVKAVDVVYAHRPDKLTPMEETVRAFSDVITQGKAHYWGTSEWSPAAIMEAYHIAKRLGLHAPICEQPQYSMLMRNRVENEYEHLTHTDIRYGLTTWSPLASGLLSGKYKSLRPEDFPAGTRLGDSEWVRSFMFKDGGVSFEVKSVEHAEKILEGLRLIAERLGCTMSQLALAWILKNEHVSTVITGASRPEQIVENFKAIDVYRKLTEADVAEIEKLLDNAPSTAPPKRLFVTARHTASPMVFPPDYNAAK